MGLYWVQKAFTSDLVWFLTTVWFFGDIIMLNGGWENWGPEKWMTNKHRLLKINPGLVPAMSQRWDALFPKPHISLPLEPLTPSSVGVLPYARPGTLDLFYSTSLWKENHLQPLHRRKNRGQRSECSCSRSSLQFSADRRCTQTQVWDLPLKLQWLDNTAALCSLRTLQKWSLVTE